MGHYAKRLSDLDERPTRGMKAAGRAATELGFSVAAYEWAPFIGNLVRVTDGTRHYHIDRWGRVSDSDENGIIARRSYPNTSRFKGYIAGVRRIASMR